MMLPNKKSVRSINTKFGVLKLSDGSYIICRVAIVDVKPLEVASPFGVEFDVKIIAGISVYPSKETLEKIKNFKALTPNAIPPNTWEQLDIVEKSAPSEEMECEFPKLGRYLISVALEPIMASFNTSAKTPRGEPLYVIRWAHKISWKKIEN